MTLRREGTHFPVSVAREQKDGPIIAFDIKGQKQELMKYSRMVSGGHTMDTWAGWREEGITGSLPGAGLEGAWENLGDIPGAGRANRLGGGWEFEEEGIDLQAP